MGDHGHDVFLRLSRLDEVHGVEKRTTTLQQGRIEANEVSYWVGRITHHNEMNN